MSRTYRITALVGGRPDPALKAALRSAVGAQRHDRDPDAVSKRDGRLALSWTADLGGGWPATSYAKDIAWWLRGALDRPRDLVIEITNLDEEHHGKVPHMRFGFTEGEEFDAWWPPGEALAERASRRPSYYDFPLRNPNSAVCSLCSGLDGLADEDGDRPRRMIAFEGMGGEAFGLCDLSLEHLSHALAAAQRPCVLDLDGQPLLRALLPIDGKPGLLPWKQHDLGLLARVLRNEASDPEYTVHPRPVLVTCSACRRTSDEAPVLYNAALSPRQPVRGQPSLDVGFCAGDLLWAAAAVAAGRPFSEGWQPPLGPETVAERDRRFAEGLVIANDHAEARRMARLQPS
jgi:hypothetical protein